MFITLLHQHFVHMSLIAAAVAALVSGALSPLVIARGQAFSVHGIAELGLTGAAGGLLAGIDAATGALIGSAGVGAALGILGLRDRDRDSATGVVLAFGLGLGGLFLTRLNNNSASTGFGLLFGSIGSVSQSEVELLSAVTAVTLVILAICWRPLWFASIDPEAAAARGVPVRTLAVTFPILLGAAVSEVLQVTGVLLILTMIVTPAAAATRVSARPRTVVLLSIALAMLASVGGVLASLEWGGPPPSFFVATISFISYVIARVSGEVVRARRPAADLHS
jgi:zinc/manganese transport system permease protein